MNEWIKKENNYLLIACDGVHHDNSRVVPDSLAPKGAMLIRNYP